MWVNNPIATSPAFRRGVLRRSAVRERYHQMLRVSSAQHEEALVARLRVAVLLPAALLISHYVPARECTFEVARVRGRGVPVTPSCKARTLLAQAGLLACVALHPIGRLPHLFRGGVRTANRRCSWKSFGLQRQEVPEARSIRPKAAHCPCQVEKRGYGLNHFQSRSRAPEDL